MKTYILQTVRREHPIQASVLKSDIRLMVRGGATGLDAEVVLRTLDELERDGLVIKTLGGYVPIYPKLVEKPKQREMFA